MISKGQGLKFVSVTTECLGLFVWINFLVLSLIIQLWFKLWTEQYLKSEYEMFLFSLVGWLNLIKENDNTLAN